MGRKVDLTGRVFWNLRVIEETEMREPSGGSVIWRCECKCGREHFVPSRSLVQGTTKSCGCLHRRFGKGCCREREFHDECGHRKTVLYKGCCRERESHGESGHRKTVLYKCWEAIVQRCTNPNDKRYPSYGGRGITVCDAWRNSFIAFRDWANANGYREGLEIDREDNDGGYEPSNCRWVTHRQNNWNTRRSRLCEINGEIKSLAEWCEIYNMDYALVHWRIHHGRWDVEKALTMPRRVHKK